MVPVQLRFRKAMAKSKSGTKSTKPRGLQSVSKGVPADEIHDTGQRSGRPNILSARPGVSPSYGKPIASPTAVPRMQPTTLSSIMDRVSSHHFLSVNFVVRPINVADINIGSAMRTILHRSLE